MLERLRAYPEIELGDVPSRRWMELCDELSAFEMSWTPRHISPERKWELVSAIQKAIRRGDRALALQLIAAVENMPGEWPYFWRRLSVIACEDIGSGDEALTTFVVACSVLFTPSKAKVLLPTISSFLIARMCETPYRSRTACSIATIQAAVRAGYFAERRCRQDDTILHAISVRTRNLQNPDSRWRGWQRRNNWRGAGLLGFLDLNLPFETEEASEEIHQHELMSELPNFCYDMYTRLGRSVLKHLIDGASGAKEIKTFFLRVPVKDPTNAAGEALFFAEGGLVRGEMVCPPVRDLMHRAMARTFGISDEAWRELRRLVAEAIIRGTVDRLRLEELDRRSAQGELFAL